MSPTAPGWWEYLALVDDQDAVNGTGVAKVEAILDALAEDPSGAASSSTTAASP